MTDVKPARLTARLFTNDRVTVEVPDVPVPPPATAGRITFEIPYPAGEQLRVVHRVEVINQDTGAVGRRSIMPVSVGPGDTLTVEMTVEDLFTQGLLAPAGRPASAPAPRGKLQEALDEAQEFLAFSGGYADSREVRLMAGTADEDAVISLGTIRLLADAARIIRDLGEMTGGTPS
jgi:hypothetical protein